MTEFKNTERELYFFRLRLSAVGVFVWLGKYAAIPALDINYRWLTLLVVLLVVTAVGCGWGLWKMTRFS